MKKILMVGISCVDHIWQITHFPPTHSRTKSTDYQIQGGGHAATAAVTAAKLGAKAYLCSLHGDDANGQTATLELERYGVDTSMIVVPEESQTIVSSILVSPEGERYIFPYMGRNLLDKAEQIDLALIANLDCILTDGRYPVLNEAILKEAKAKGVPIVADYGNLDNWHLASYADYLIVSEECANDILKQHKQPQGDFEAAIELLKHHKRQYVGITLGEEGFLYTHEAELRHLSAFPVEVVDTTGAGDVFHGAFAYAIAHDWDIHYAGLFASVTAALSCTALGGRAGIPDSQTVEHLLKEQSLKEMNEQQWT